MADIKVSVSTHDLVSLLSSENRDFLVRNNGDQVKVHTLLGKIVGLYFSGSWCGPCRQFTPDLVGVYDQLQEKGNFEVIFISSDKDDESFNNYFSKMPWLAVPFADSETRKQLKDSFEVRGIPTLLIFNEDGNLTCPNGRSIIMDYEADAYPFTLERIQLLKDEEEAARTAQSISYILTSPARDFLISNSGRKIPVAELEGKMVGLYFSIAEICHDFTLKLVDVYEKIKEKGELFEIVLISLESGLESFEQELKIMPWLSLPFNDKTCGKLVRYFDLSVLPTLVIIGHDGKTLQPNAAELIEDHGVKAYPFSKEKLHELEEIERAIMEAQTLESILISGELDYVLGKNGSRVSIRDLVGKNILLYFSAHWCPPCRAFLPKLIKAYQEIKAKDDGFEVIFVSSDEDQSSFDDFYATMPWLALPFKDGRKAFLERRFKINGIPTAVAIGPSGRTVTTEARELIEAHGPDAYPFTEEQVKALSEAKLIEDKADGGEKHGPGSGKDGWVCDGDVCHRSS